MSDHNLLTMFHLDSLAIVMLSVILFIGACVLKFTSRYLRGDGKYAESLTGISLLLVCLSVMVCTDHLVLYFISCVLSNLLLVKLMIHKPQWKAAFASGRLAARNYLIGLTFLGLSFFILYIMTGSTSIQAIVNDVPESYGASIAIAFLTLAAMAQSAIWPFHRWLLSSLNSPTPVSAIMHAGLVNGGGFLLARFAPLYLAYPSALKVVLIIGLFTATLGTLWKLMQTDIKRMLACSTMAQMGFMFVQIGLGLFPLAVAHLCLHGFFKAYLFMSSGTMRDKRITPNQLPPVSFILAAMGCGVISCYAYALVSGKTGLIMDSSLIIFAMVFITASQIALSVMGDRQIRKLPTSMYLTTLLGIFYGGIASIFSVALESMNFMHPGNLTVLEVLALLVLTATWLGFFAFLTRLKDEAISPLLLKFYVSALNASQPHPSTITGQRNSYRYL